MVLPVGLEVLERLVVVRPVVRSYLPLGNEISPPPKRGGVPAGQSYEMRLQVNSSRNPLVEITEKVPSRIRSDAKKFMVAVCTDRVVLIN